MSRSVALLAGGLVVLWGLSLSAQEAVLGQMYGNGVHAYFSRDYARAHQYFSMAIEGHTPDPRCYYYRGLACLKLGRPQDAELDFRQGAKLESGDMNRAFNVARSLERVQGTDRSLVEQYRVEARMVALERAERERKARYEQSRKQEEELLREQAKAAPAKPAEATTEEPKARIDNPFDAGEKVKPSAEPEKPAAEPEKPAAEPEKPATEPPKPPAPEDPFATPPKPATETEKPGMEPETPAAKPPAADPFSTTPSKTETEPAPEEPKPAASKGGGLLGGLGKALGRAAAGDEAVPEKPEKPEAPADATEKPAPKPAGADPFGGDTEPKPAMKPEAKPAGADPFGGDTEAKPAAKPAAKAAGDDPFGGDTEAKPAAKPAGKSAAKAASDDPFVEEPAPAAKPAK